MGKYLFTSIKDKDESSAYPYLMKEFMYIKDETGKIKCWEMNPQNLIADYIEEHPDEFINILEAMSYEDIESIYGEVANNKDVLKYYDFDIAFRMYFNWIERLESETRYIGRYGYELFMDDIYHCGYCGKIVHRHMFNNPCPNCNKLLIERSNHTKRYGFNESKLKNERVLECLSPEED